MTDRALASAYRAAVRFGFAFIALGHAASAQEPASPQGVPRVRAEVIRGTPDMFEPRTAIANLDAGDLVAGTAWWDHDGDTVVFIETDTGYLWYPAEGAQVFEVDDATYWTEHTDFLSEIAPDGTVVGTKTFTRLLEFEPIRWTERGGLETLPVPGPGWMASALATSDDGEVVVGVARDGAFANDPANAVLWDRAGLLVLDDGGAAWSNAYDLSQDGRVAVGDFGPSDTQLEATRWIDAAHTPLGAVPGAAWSSARFTSDDGRAAIGLAEVAGVIVLVRWDGAGVPVVLHPPAGWTIETLNAISPAATAATGALSENGNWAPFVWTAGGGFTVLPEEGRPIDYDLSEAHDVSDDGTVVVGTLRSSVVFNGDPPQLGFAWTPRLGMVLVNDLMLQAGFTNPDYWTATAVSGDGQRLLATGNVPASDPHDSDSVIVRIRP